MSHKTTISLCMIVKNEEKVIENCLKSVRGVVDEIIIVDTGSTDKTVELCKKYTKKIFFTKWENDFSKPRNLSIKKATSDWIFLLDADEVISPTDYKKIKELTNYKEAAAFQFTTRNYTDLYGVVGWKPNDFIYPEAKQYKGWVGSVKTRLFRNHIGLYFKGEVHEMVEHELYRRKLVIRTTDVPIHHYGKSLLKTKNEEKTKIYLEIGKEKIKNNPDDFQANFELGIQYRELKDLDAAEIYFRKTIELQPKFGLAYSELGIILGLKNKIRESIDIFNKGIKQYPNCADLYSNLGFTYEVINNFEKAEEFYKKALQITPHCETARKNLLNLKEKKNKQKAGISLCMIVKNEEKNLEELLSSVYPFFEEMIIVDTGSNDNTRAVAEKYGAKVFDFTWCNDFGKARNESIKHAAFDWIIWLDADDRLKEEDLKKIRKVIMRTCDCAYFCILSNSHESDANTTCNQLRIFPNLKGVAFERPIHEQVIFSLNKLNIKIAYTDIVINHTGYADEKMLTDKLRRNIEIIERELNDKIGKDDYHLKFQLASSLVMLNETSKAEKLLKEVIALDPAVMGNDMYLYSLVFLGRILKAGNIVEAEKYFNEALKIDSTYGVAYFCLGELYFGQNNWDKAIEYFELAKHHTIKVTNIPIKKSRLDFLIYFYLGKAYQEIKNIVNMEKNFDIAFNLGGNKLEIKYDIGMVYIKEKKFLKAVDIFNFLYEKKFRTRDSLFNLAVSKFYMNDYKNAKILFEELLKNYPDINEVYINLGAIEENLGNTDKAIEYYLKAISFDKSNFDCSANLAHIYLQIGDMENSGKYFEAASIINNHAIDIQLGLAVITAKRINQNISNNEEETIIQFKRLEKILIKIQNTDHLVQNNIEMDIDYKLEWIGDIYWNAQKIREALLCYKAVSFLRNDEKYYKEKLIDYHILIGTPVNAITIIESLLPKAPNDQKLLFKLGQCYRELRIPEAAKLCYEQILKHNPTNFEVQQLIAKI